MTALQLDGAAYSGESAMSFDCTCADLALPSSIESPAGLGGDNGTEPRPSDQLLFVRVDLQWEPLGTDMGLQDMATASRSVWETVPQAADNLLEFSMELTSIDYLGAMFPWQSQMIGLGTVHLSMEPSSVERGVLGRIAPSADTQQRMRITKEKDRETQQLLHQYSEGAFYRMVDLCRRGKCIYPDMYRQTVPSVHFTLPCCHLEAQFGKDNCVVHHSVVSSALVVGCGLCSMTLEDFIKLTYTDPQAAANGPYKMTLCAVANGFRYQSDYDALHRASERFTCLWGMLGTCAALGKDNSSLCGDCEDTAYCAAKLHIGVQNLTWDDVDVPSLSSAMMGGCVATVAEAAASDYVELLVAARRLALFYHAVVPTCSTFAVSATGVISDEFSTHTTMVLFPVAQLTRMLPLHRRQQASCRLGEVVHLTHGGAPLSPVLCEGTALVSQRDDVVNKSTPARRDETTDHWNNRMQVMMSSNQYSFSNNVLEETHPQNWEDGDFYYAVTQLNIEIGGFYPRSTDTGKYGVLFSEFIHSPETVDLEAMHPQLTLEQQQTAWRMAVVECPAYTLTPHPTVCGTDAAERWQQLKRINRACVDTGGYIGILRGHASSAADLGHDDDDRRGSPGGRMMPIADGLNLVVY